MAGVGMANHVLTKEDWDIMRNLAASPGTTYCKIKVNPYDSEAYKNLLKTPGFTVFRETVLDCSDDCTRYLLSHPSSVFLMGRVFLIDPEASCFTETEDFTASKRYCNLEIYNLSHGLKLYKDSMEELFFSVRNFDDGEDIRFYDRSFLIHSKKAMDERLKDEKFRDHHHRDTFNYCYDIETITIDK